WPDGLRALSGGREVDGILDDLTRRGAVVPAPSPRLREQREYGFSHALFREVSYGRLPRASRARKHLEAGTWLVSAAGERSNEIADTLANHFATAAELADVAGEPEVLEAARGPAIRWLMAAGEAAIRVDESGAFTVFERARDLGLRGTAERAQATARGAWLGRRVGSL